MWVIDGSTSCMTKRLWICSRGVQHMNDRHAHSGTYLLWAETKDSNMQSPAPTLTEDRSMWVLGRLAPLTWLLRERLVPPVPPCPCAPANLHVVYHPMYVFSASLLLSAPMQGRQAAKGLGQEGAGTTH